MKHFGANLNEVESYMNQKGIEYRTIDKTRAGRIYERLKAHSCASPVVPEMFESDNEIAASGV